MTRIEEIDVEKTRIMGGGNPDLSADIAEAVLKLNETIRAVNDIGKALDWLSTRQGEDTGGLERRIGNLEEKVSKEITEIWEVMRMKNK